MSTGLPLLCHSLEDTNTVGDPFFQRTLSPKLDTAVIFHSTINGETKPLERHEVVTLISRGLVTNDGGTDIEVTLRRVDPPPVEPDIWTRKQAVSICRRRGGPPSRPPKLPQEPRAPRQLVVQLGERIGDGRIGSVHDISILSQVIHPASETDTALEEPPYIPPLVAKVAFSKHTTSLLGEASMYEELETLQGVIMPRCYGLFEATVGGEVDVLPWKKTTPKLNAKPKKTKKDKKILILLLEKLGKRIKPEEPDNPQSKYKISVKTKKEMFTMCNVLAHYGVTHDDIRADNILKAPASPPGLESLECPIRHQKYSWRLIDFDRAYKSNLTKAVINGAHGSELMEIMVYWPGTSMFIHEDDDAESDTDSADGWYDDWGPGNSDEDEYSHSSEDGNDENE